MKILFSCLLTLSLITTAFGHGGGEAEIEIGADKGVLEVTKDKAFRLSPEALKNFEIKSVAATSDSIALPKEAIVHSLKHAQIFRLREGLLKAIPFKTQSKNDRTWTIQSPELRAKDEVVTRGVGFLRMIAAQLGEEETEEEKAEEAKHGHGSEESAGHAAHGEEGEEHHD